MKLWITAPNDGTPPLYAFLDTRCGQQAHSAQPGAGGAVKGIWPPLRKLFCHAQHLLILGKRKARSLCGNRTGTKL